MPKRVMIQPSIDDKLRRKFPDVDYFEKGIRKEKLSNIISTKVSSNRRKRAVRKIFQDFADSSSIHGLKYIISLTFNIGYLGRLLWICTMVAAIIGLDIMIKTYWQYLRENPHRLFIETLHAPIFLAAFPAVTICPNLPTMVQRRYELLSNLKLPANMTDEEALLFLKHGTDITLNENYLQKLGSLLDENQWRLVDFLRLLKPCEDMLDSCWWHGRRINCSDHIKQSHAYNGICCAFNYYLEDLIKYSIHIQDIRLIHTSRSGPKSGLTLVFNRELFSDDNSTGDASSNFVNSIKLLTLVHHTAGYPNAETVAYSLQQGQGLRLSVQPNLIRTPPDLYDGYFNGTLQPMCVPNSKESNLRFFPQYRHSNCFTDCKIRKMFNACGCIRYIYAPMANYSQVPLCEIPDFKCVFDFIKYKPMVDYKTCFCLHTCDDLSYQSTATKYSLKNSPFVLSPIYKRLSSKQAILNVHLKMDTFTIYKVESTFSNWNLLADVGGIFSLCLGCSILSAVEIAYFIYLFCCAIFKKKRSYNNSKKNVMR